MLFLLINLTFIDRVIEPSAKWWCFCSSHTYLEKMTEISTDKMNTFSYIQRLLTSDCTFLENHNYVHNTYDGDHFLCFYISLVPLSSWQGHLTLLLV